ncbi:MAG: S-layer homology domain-containing protein [Hominilimicola sp.]
MKTKKLISYLLACSMLAASTAAFAAAPSAYDGQTYESVGYTSDDPDGKINLAVIANGDVKIGTAMEIIGSVYSNGTIYTINGSGNKIDGLFISGTKNTKQYVTEWYQDETDFQWKSKNTYLDGYYLLNQNDGSLYADDATYGTKPEFKGSIHDTETSFECTYEEFTVPAISNNIGDVVMTVYPGSDWFWSEEKGSYSVVREEEAPRTITEDTYIENLTMNGSLVEGYEQAMTIDTTNGDVTVVINNLVNPISPSIKVIGDNQAYIYINNVNKLSDLRINHNGSDWSGSDENTHVYITGGNVVLDADKISAADISVNAATLEISGSAVIKGDIDTNAFALTVIGGATEVTGIVCAPYAETKIVNSAAIYGQLHTDTLNNNGSGRIVWNADGAVEKAEPTAAPVKLDIKEDVVYIPIGGSADIHIDHNTTYDWDFTKSGNDVLNFQSGGLKSETTGDAGDLVYMINSYYDDTTWTITPRDHDVSKLSVGREFTLKAVSREDANVFDTVKVVIVDASASETPSAPIPSGEPVDLNGVGYAYIFGYEPAIQRVDVTDDEGNVIGGKWVAEVQMAPDDYVTREQVASMIMRLIDQKYDTSNNEYPLTDNIAHHEGTWYARGLAYLAGNGAFDGIDSVDCGPVTRGEVAKLIAYGLNLSDAADTTFTDIASNKYKTYIEIVNSYGYMQGISDTEFEPDRIMTRAEFCSMINQVIGRSDARLEGADGTVVTPELYSIVDIDGHWAEEVMLRATSAYDANGYVDIETRLGNIRNILDKYNSQTMF